ncbi:MAG: hypothetical protein QOF63_1235, partial [Thermoanaerobaculia bacterium]|nr:hypothetical protein [Thermoanaerobaculia bacterium]
LNQKIDFNVATVSSTSTVSAAYVALPASLYFSVPDPALGLSPTVAYVALPADGTPPRYSELLRAVELVLSQDPGPPNGSLAQLSPLTPAQARLIAHEIAWNRTLAPFPAPPLQLEDLYTRPPTRPAAVDITAADQARRQFEAERDGYYAMQDIRADRITNYVFAISAAVWAEERSAAAVLGRLTFPVDPEAAPDSVTIKKAEVALIPRSGTAAALGFEIPAPFFYALGATMAPSIDAVQRFKSATLYEEEQTIADVERAIDAGIIDPQAITPAQAARRLNALGIRTDTGLPQCPVEGDVVPLLNAWLAFRDADIDVFWAANIHTFAAGHLDLVLSALTKQQASLIAALRAVPIRNIDELKALNTEDWTRFFLPSHTDLLPDFTKPGTPQERVAAFIRQLRRYFPVDGVSTATPAIASAPAPGFGVAVDDPIAAFVAAYNALHPTPPLLFGTPIDQAAYRQALMQVFPDDAEARAWLDQLLRSIDDLVHMTQGIDPALQFSLIEALYARGFRSMAGVQLLSLAEFQEALTGTVAYAHAQEIYTNAGGTGGANHGPTGPFTPVNPDGSLINCIPPWHLSPFGPVAYLHELLMASDRTTCDEPTPDLDGQRTLDVVIAARRGPLGDLHATAANLDTALPAIDLVNESLEALASGSPAGAVYDTNAVELNGHRLRPPGSTADRVDGTPYEHDPVVMFGAIPEHSTPACPVGQPHGYELLRSDFSSPVLPYSQPLDVSRSYLRQLGTSRFATMRRFRKDITEFVLDPSLEPADFQRHLWRYPVRLNIAIEYLGISPEEYALLYSTVSPSVATLYGFLPDDQSWATTVLDVPEFLTRTGLSYCEFLELWQSGYVPFSAAGTERGFPDCEPCCPENLRIRFDTQDVAEPLRRLAVFIRLWRTLQGVAGAKYSFRELCDICLVLELFLPNGSVNPDFIRQLAAFQMLRDDFSLELGVRRNAPSGATGANRTALLALWVGPNSPNWSWALEHLLDGIEDVAGERHDCEREAEFMKVIAANLDALSSLVGFDPAGSATWHAHPASTLRFSEVLLKIYLSDFTVGEILFLFTVDPHFDGDDPFPQEDDNESLDSPLNLPEDADKYSLWELRKNLRDLHTEDEECRKWTWQHIVNSLRDEFGYVSSGAPDRLQSLGEHFFPEVLSRHGYGAPPSNRRYSTPLAGSNAAMWNTPPDGPFHYDAAAQELSIALPLRDEAVVRKLNHNRQLTQVEQDAVAQLYFSPRADLAPFAMIFENFTEAENILIEEEDERKRWHYFRNAFALFHARCSMIAAHLAEHVAAATDGECMEEGLAWKVLRSLLADENRGTTPWEDDSGQPPAAHWWPQPGGGAFAALLGLTGTGLFGEITSESGTPVWNEIRGPMRAFGPHRNKSGAPFPTVLPSMDFNLPADQLQFAVLRNGFAIRDTDGASLGGAEGFRARWSGVLLVEKAGSYEFFAGMPTEHGSEPDCEDAEHQRWRVTLQRGQRTWFLLSRRWAGEDAPDAHSAPLSLKRGAYSIAIDFAQRPREFDESYDARRGHAGFEVKYKGPDSNDELTPLPLDHLFRDVNDSTLAAGLKVVAAAHDFLAGHFSSSLRGIRRTYIRAFEALLFAHRFDLSARLMVGHSQSEIGYLLAHPANFLGTSYYPTGPVFHSHHAYFDFNLLPVRDDYHPPAAADDERVQPSLRRRQALFDWWERIFDYTVMRRESRRGRERPVWLLFLESAENQPDVPDFLVRHLGVDIRHAPLLLRYDPAYDITSANLEDERWAVRIWHGEKWIRALVHHFVPRNFNGWRPDLWASNDPGAISPGETESGNANLTNVVQDGSFENGEPRRYADVQQVNDGLRERGRTALLAYLCGMNRVPLPWGTNVFAKTPQDLSDLLLQDVQVGLSERTSRIEEAVSVVQTFVERARLGLEPGFVITPAFVYAWDRLFATFHVWQACQRRRIYRETYVEWDELEKARRTEAFRFLESELRRSALTFPVPGGKEYWPGNRPAPHPSIELLQNREPSHLKIIPQPEMLGLMGTPERDARPTWLAPMSNGQQGLEGLLLANAPATTAADTQGLPLWIQAAIRLGVRFLRIAAAGDPPASAGFNAHGKNNPPCCSCCGKAHEPLVDEYYFWLVDAKFYEAQAQDATWGTTPTDPTSDWERDNKLPGLLYWPAQPMVRLYWRRFHNGEFQAARRSDDGVHVQTAGNPQLVFLGRTGDSLQFSVTAAVPIPVGFSDPSPWGFRYDMVPDTAVVLPEVVATPLPPPSTGGLSAYPYFSYYEPGAPLEPSSWFTPAITIAGTLRTHCRYEAALKWYEVYYKPLENDNRWARCDHQPGLVDPAGRPRPDNPCCRAESASDELVHQQSVLLHYLETLAQFGDAAMCCANSPEGFHKARLIFDTMARILGRHPQATLSTDDGGDPQTVALFVPRFAPLNPRLLALYDLVTERLSVIHHSLNKRRLRNGTLHADMPYWGNSPVRGGWRTAAAGACDPEDDCCCPRSPYRFLFVLPKALEVSGDVRALGSELLSAYEKGDAELLAQLRVTHEGQLLNRTREVRENEWRSADWELQALKKAKEGALARLQYYSDLIANGLISREQAYETLTNASMITRAGGNTIEAITQANHLVPDPTTGAIGPLPVAIFGIPVGSKVANSFSAAARILYAVADITGTLASLRLTQAGWDRRLQEWQQQVIVITIEIEQIQRQILGAERRRDAALRSLNNQRLQMEQSAEVQDFLRDKFTSHALYLHLQQETAALYRGMYDLALCWAQQAQRAFNFERGHTTRKFLPESTWDGLHEGLLSGERLQLALRQMEKSFLDLNSREYELAKHVSLRMDFALELLRLKATGFCEVDIPEWMFDLDYPGQYMRRLKNVSITIPCVSGPYTGVHCRLTLLSSRTRIDPSLLHINHCCPDCTPADGYDALPDDPRIVCQHAALEALATSSGVNDTGMFELNFRDERYLPFEYAGAVSRWRIELPPENNQFDIDSVTDVVLHFSYMAREGGSAFREGASDAAQRHLTTDGVRYFDVASDFSDAWQIFQSQARDEDCDRTLALRLRRAMFPFLPGDRPVEIQRMDLFFEASCARPGNSHVVEFLAEHRHGEAECCCELQEIACIASSEWPCLFHGVIETTIPPLGPHGHYDMGAFRFPDGVGEIRRAYLICGYQALEMERCEPFDLPSSTTCEKGRAHARLESYD